MLNAYPSPAHSDRVLRRESNKDRARRMNSNRSSSGPHEQTISYYEANAQRFVQTTGLRPDRDDVTWLNVLLRKR